MMETNIKEGFIKFKYIKDKDFPPLKDISYLEHFNMFLEAYVENKTLVFSNNERRTLFYEGDIQSVSATVTKRDLITPLIFHTYSYKVTQPDGRVLYYSKLSKGDPAAERTFPETRDMCIAVIDPRYYPNSPEYDIEIIGYINNENFLCYRTSADDFNQEFIINKIPDGSRLVKIGLNSRFKFQFILVKSGDRSYYV